MAHLNYFLGIEVHKIHKVDLILTQRKFIRKFLAKTHMDQAKPIATPMTTTFTLSISVGDRYENPMHYRGVFGGIAVHNYHQT